VIINLATSVEALLFMMLFAANETLSEECADAKAARRWYSQRR
jgi:hypothetical protein